MQITDEMVERLARRLCKDEDADDTHGGPHPSGIWLEDGEPWWTGYKDVAKDVLNASLALILAEEENG